ncbi:subunit of the Arp2/3 complex [Malassezia cuniculi]|uniref:Actin-related protein 2/3 complex subunit 3 n=1 Tax=Malassezia cuniculi TaxID=948313 RepID=A0AAF0ETY2_9BASI|nr:subunit of the Arp2/3 complex [Malassezia cuniculi]
MPSYHSSYNEEPNVRLIASMSLLPLKALDPERMDIVDESIDLFRANTLFRNFEIKGPADRVRYVANEVLIYLILFISDCLTRIAASRPQWNKHEAQRQLASYAVDSFALPGDANFPLSSLYSAPESRADADTLRQYLTQARQETAMRLVEKIYDGDVPSRWWLAFTKRKL